MNKKGDTEIVLWFLVNLILSAVVLAPFVTVLSNLESKNSFERIFMAKDVALSINTIQASPNDILYLYIENEFPFQIIINQSKVTVIDQKTEKSSSYPYIRDLNIKIKTKKINSIPIQKGEITSYYLPLGFKKKDNTIDAFAALTTSSLLQ